MKIIIENNTLNRSGNLARIEGTKEALDLVDLTMTANIMNDSGDALSVNEYLDDNKIYKLLRELKQIPLKNDLDKNSYRRIEGFLKEQLYIEPKNRTRTRKEALKAIGYGVISSQFSTILTELYSLLPNG